jgi:hypothetical protein
VNVARRQVDVPDSVLAETGRVEGHRMRRLAVVDDR